MNHTSGPTTKSRARRSAGLSDIQLQACEHAYKYVMGACNLESLIIEGRRLDLLCQRKGFSSDELTAIYVEVAINCRRSLEKRRVVAQNLEGFINEQYFRLDPQRADTSAQQREQIPDTCCEIATAISRNEIRSIVSASMQSLISMESLKKRFQALLFEQSQFGICEHELLALMEEERRQMLLRTFDHMQRCDRLTRFASELASSSF